MLQLHVNRGTTDADQQRLAINKLAPELKKKIEDLRYRQEDIRDVTDRHVIRRSFALALLKWRGQTLPIES